MSSPEKATRFPTSRDGLVRILLELTADGKIKWEPPEGLGIMAKMRLANVEVNAEKLTFMLDGGWNDGVELTAYGPCGEMLIDYCKQPEGWWAEAPDLWQLGVAAFEGVSRADRSKRNAEFVRHALNKLQALADGDENAEAAAAPEEK